MTFLQMRSRRARTGAHARWISVLLSVPVVLAFAACQPAGEAPAGGDAKQGERKSPFATDNVSVAPQVEGRPAVPTPPPAPRPGSEPTPESQ